MDKLLITSSPHIRSNTNVQSIMRDVIIALLPAVVMGTYLFGIRALLVVLVSTASCVFFEWGYCKVMKKHSKVYDLSAVVTGILLDFVFLGREVKGCVQPFAVQPLGG